MKKNLILIAFTLSFISLPLYTSTGTPNEDHENIPAEILAWFKPDDEITLTDRGDWGAEESMSIAEAWGTQENEDSDDEDVAIAAKIRNKAQSYVSRMNQIAKELTPWVSLDDIAIHTITLEDGSTHQTSLKLKDVIFATVAEPDSSTKSSVQAALVWFQNKVTEQKKVPLWIWEAKIPLTQEISYTPLAFQPAVIRVGPSFAGRSAFPSNPMRPVAKATIEEIYNNPHNQEYDSCRKKLEDIHQKSIALARKNSLLEADLAELDFEQHSIKYSADWQRRRQEGATTFFELETRTFEMPKGAPLAAVYANLAVVDEADLDTLALHPHFPTETQDEATAENLTSTLDAQTRPLSLKEKAALFFYGQKQEENPEKTWSLFKKIGVSTDETRRPAYLPDYTAFKREMNTLLDSMGTVSPRARRYLTSQKMLVWYYANGDQAIDKKLFTNLHLFSEEAATQAYENPELLEWFGNQKLSCDIIIGSRSSVSGNTRTTVTDFIRCEPATVLQTLNAPPDHKDERLAFLKNKMDDQKRRPMIASAVSAAVLIAVGATLFTRNLLCRNEDNKTIYLATSYIKEELDKNGGEINDLFLENLQKELQSTFHCTAEEIRIMMPSWKIIAENPQQLFLATTVSYTNKKLDKVSISTSGLPERMRNAVKVIQQGLGLRWSISAKIARLFKEKK